MNLKIINSNELDRNLKATSHKSGKLGFTIEAAEKLELSKDQSLTIAVNEDPTDKNLYVIVNPGEKEGAFKVAKAGLYYYVNLKALFESLSIDYVNDTAVYDIVRENILGTPGFKFKRREKHDSKRGEH